MPHNMPTIAVPTGTWLYDCTELSIPTEPDPRVSLVYTHDGNSAPYKKTKPAVTTASPLSTMPSPIVVGAATGDIDTSGGDSAVVGGGEPGFGDSGSPVVASAGDLGAGPASAPPIYDPSVPAPGDTDDKPSGGTVAAATGGDLGGTGVIGGSLALPVKSLESVRRFLLKPLMGPSALHPMVSGTLGHRGDAGLPIGVLPPLKNI